MALLILNKHRFQAAISGRVLDAQTSLPVAGIRVQITTMPAAFQKTLALLATQYGAAWATKRDRPDIALSELDGAFNFGDLPDGAYVLTASLPGTNSQSRYAPTTANVTVSHAANGTVTTPFVPISMPPTVVKGIIFKWIPPQGNQPATTAPLRLALVRVRGTGETDFTDVNGAYYLTGVDPGQQTLEISAPGYVSITAAATIQAGVVLTLAQVTLNPAS